MSIQPKIVQIMKAHKRPQDSIPFLLQLRQTQTEANKKTVEIAICLLLETQHDWQNVIKYLKSWKNVELASQFYQRMKKRCQQNVDQNQLLGFDQILNEVNRLSQKYWMNFSEKKPKVQYYPNQSTKHQKDQQNTNSKASRPLSGRSIVLTSKFNPTNKNVVTKSQSFQSEVHILKKNESVSEAPASLQNYQKKQSVQNNTDSKNSIGFPQNQNSNSYSIGTGFRKGIDKNSNIFKLIKKQEKSKEIKAPKQPQLKQKYQSPPKQQMHKSENKQKDRNIKISLNQQQMVLDKSHQTQQAFNYQAPKLKSLRKPVGLSPYKPQIKNKKFTIKGAGLINSITDSADRRNAQKFSQFQNDFSFQHNGPKFIFESSRKNHNMQEKTQELKQLQEDLKNQKNFSNPQSSSFLSQMKSSSLNANLNLSNKSKTILGRGRNPPSLYTPEQLRLINFDKVDEKYHQFKSKAQKKIGIDVFQMFNDYVKIYDAFI